MWFWFDLEILIDYFFKSVFFNIEQNYFILPFSEKKSLGTSWRKSYTHFWNQRKIPLLLIPFAANFQEIFFQLS